MSRKSSKPDSLSKTNPDHKLPVSDLEKRKAVFRAQLQAGTQFETKSQEAFPELPDLELIEKIGAGGFGNVWKAFDKNLKRIVAVKIPKNSHVGSERYHRFIREAKLAAQLNHPGIVSIFELGVHQDEVYFVSEFVEGSLLDHWYQQQNIGHDEIVEVIRHAALAIDHAHKQGIVHRDLKPENILMDVDNRPHILDFGLAKGFGSEMLTHEGTVVGTPAYMSPEQARGKSAEINAASDIYSLGVIFYECLTGELPFRGTSEMLIHQLLFDDPLPPRNLDHHIPPDLNTICLKCVEKSPEQRFATAGELADELERYQSGMPILSRPISSLARTTRWCRRNKLVTTLATMVFLTLVLGVVIASWFAAEAARESHQNRRVSYVLAMNLVEQNVNQGEYRRAIELLKSFQPSDSESDLRQIEWYHWWDKCHEDLLHNVPGTKVIRTLARANDTGTIVWGGDDGIIRAMDSDSGRQLPNIGKTSAPINSIAFAVESNQVVVGSENGEVSVWPVGGSSPAKPVILRHADSKFSRIRSVAVSSTGQIIAAGGLAHAGELYVWDKEGKPTELTWLTNYVQETINQVAVSPDGRRLALAKREGENNGRTIVLDFLSGNLLFSRKQTYSTLSVQFVDNDRVLFGEFDEAKGDQVSIVDIRDQTVVSCKHPEGLIRSTLSLATNLPHNLIAVGSTRGRFALFDSRTGNHLHTYQGSSGRILALDISSDAAEIVSAGDEGELRTWRIGDQTADGLLTYSVEGQVVSLDVGKSRNRMVASTSSGNAYVWDLPSRKPVFKQELTDGNPVVVACSQDGSIVAASSLVRDSANQIKNKLLIWDVEKDSIRQLDSLDFPISVLSFSPDNNKLAVGGGVMTSWPGEPTQLVVYDIQKGQRRVVCDGHIRTIKDICFSDDGKWIASTGSDRTIRLWDADAGREVRKWQADPDDKHNLYFAVALDFTRDQRNLIAGYSNGTIVKLDVAGKNQPIIQSMNHDQLKGLVLVEKSDTAITIDNSQSTIAVFDLPTGLVRSNLDIGLLHPTAIAANANYVIVGDQDGKISAIRCANEK